MKYLALMISDSGRVLKEIPMLKGLTKDDTPKEFAYIGDNKAIRNSDIDKFISIIKEAHWHINLALGREKELIDDFSKAINFKNEAHMYATNFYWYLSDILKEFKEIEILEVLHPLLGCKDNDEFLKKYWRINPFL